MKEKELSLCAQRVQAAQRIAVLTGAGISTESGIPDFRSPSGLWRKPEVQSAITRETFFIQPQNFYKYFTELFLEWQEVFPNAGHLALSNLERMGKTVRIATQNIDGLHQAAGSSQVIELHGHLRTATCPKCKAKESMETVKTSLKQSELPKCSCGAILKPDVVLFGDPLDLDDWNTAQEWMRQADLLLCVGTSLTVTPANSLILRRHSDSTLVIINKEPTMYDHMADFVFHGMAGTVLPKLWG
ncbi:NAD-dependent protein deacylase [Heliobacillus mobilis]|uniref:protein acetyllysine N-acetyltransferase n=1 Tax=Heliobacterium mobile TaxID=28064 RepID=A0A6I3SM25_HELMO|nr:NAD-dependent deacylase [Heliobacterium mobile]MTV49785.1 NAD-dependent protein deacylase [Heliobacterium mobile]